MGDLKLALFLAFKSIFKGNRWALVLIVLVMSLSFANLILTPSILSGVTRTLDRQQVENIYANILIDPPDNEYYLNNAENIERLVEQIPGVSGAASHLNSSALIEYRWKDKESASDKGISGTYQVTGINPEREVNVTGISSHIIEGSYLEPGDRDKIVLGVEIAGGEQAETSEFLTLQGAKVGDKVRLTYPNGVQKEYTVKGIFKAREMVQADRTAYITRTEMASILGRDIFDDRASQVLVKIADETEESRIIGEIKSFGFNALVRSWRDYGGTMGSIVSSFDIVASLISGIGLVVAAIVMFIVIYINVINKRRQIGILRAIGIKRDIIIGSYLTQALFYAALGIIFGGLIFGYGILPYFKANPLDLPVGLVSLSINPATVHYAIFGLLGAAVMAGLVPVFNITRQGIIQSIWGN